MGSGIGRRSGIWKICRFGLVIVVCYVVEVACPATVVSWDFGTYLFWAIVVLGTEEVQVNLGWMVALCASTPPSMCLC